MTQLEVIKKTKTPVTKDDIIKGLKKLGVKKTSLIEVHSSLSSFVYIINKEYDICDALIELVTHGVIIMPAHNSEFTNPEFWENPPVPMHWIPIINENRKAFDLNYLSPKE